jgi:molecular chaperone DnaK
MVKEAEEHAEEDKKRRELVEAKNQAEALIHGAQKTLSEGADKLSDSDKAPVETAVEELKQATAGEDVEDIRAKTEALGQVSMKLGEAMYAAASEETGAETGDSGGGGQAEGDSGGAAEDDKVVDADFEEVDDDHKGKTA